MPSNLNKKPFLDYPAQIQHLKNKGLLIEDDIFAELVLKKISYYNLINGYKESFKNQNTHQFHIILQIYTAMVFLIIKTSTITTTENIYPIYNIFFVK